MVGIDPTSVSLSAPNRRSERQQYQDLVAAWMEYPISGLPPAEHADCVVPLPPDYWAEHKPMTADAWGMRLAPSMTDLAHSCLGRLGEWVWRYVLESADGDFGLCCMEMDKLLRYLRQTAATEDSPKLMAYNASYAVEVLKLVHIVWVPTAPDALLQRTMAPLLSVANRHLACIDNQWLLSRMEFWRNPAASSRPEFNLIAFGYPQNMPAIASLRT